MAELGSISPMQQFFFGGVAPEIRLFVGDGQNEAELQATCTYGGVHALELMGFRNK